MHACIVHVQNGTACQEFHTLPEKYKQKMKNVHLKKKSRFLLSRFSYAYDIHMSNLWLMSPSSPGKWSPATWRNVLHLPAFIPS